MPFERRAQEELIVRTPPPALDDLETDANSDGVPDGWYNASDAKLDGRRRHGRAALRSVRAQDRAGAGGAQPRLRDRRQENRGDRAGDLGPARATSSSASARGPSPA